MERVGIPDVIEDSGLTGWVASAGAGHSAVLVMVTSEATRFRDRAFF